MRPISLSTEPLHDKIGSDINNYKIEFDEFFTVIFGVAQWTVTTGLQPLTNIWRVVPKF